MSKVTTPNGDVIAESRTIQPLTPEERDLISQILDMYAENPNDRQRYQNAMYLVAEALKNGNSPIQEGE